MLTFFASFVQADCDCLLAAFKFSLMFIFVHCLFDFFASAWIILSSHNYSPYVIDKREPSGPRFTVSLKPLG